MLGTENRLKGQAAVVTGASKGIGRASALALARAGASIVGVARTASKLEQLGDEIRALGSAYGMVVGDAADESTATQAVKQAIDMFGRIDLLLNNAGIGYYADFTDCTVEDYDAIMNTSMRATFLFTRATVPIMKEQRRGLILQISSLAGLRSFPREAIYCASKHAQVGFTNALRQELQPFGIKVGVICPAGVKTEFALARGRTPEFVANSGFLEPEDVANAVLFAASQPAHMRVMQMSLMSLEEPW